MTTKIVSIPFSPKPWQKTVLSSLERFNVLVIHRRAGKTFLATHLLVKEIFECKRKRPVVGLISPEKQQSVKNMWDDIKEIIKDIPGARPNEVEHKIEFPNGGVFYVFGAANPDAIRGGYFDMVVLDEVAQMPASLWTQVVRPMLSDRKGKAVFIGTPKGRNLFYDMYKFATSGVANWYGATFNVLDTKSLGNRSEKGTMEEVTDLKEELSEDVFNQEYMCDFDAANKGAYYAKEITRLRNEDKITKGLYDPDYPVHVGFDIGLDGTALWYAQIFGKNINLIDFDFVTGETIDWCIKHFLSPKDYTYGTIYVPHDAKKVSAADKKKSPLSLLKNHGYNVYRVKKPGNNMLDQEINLVKSSIRTCSFDSETCSNGIDHLSLYQQQWNDNAGIFMGVPKHDINSHTADAFRTLLMGLRTDKKNQGSKNVTETMTVSRYDHFSCNTGPTVDNDYDPFNI